MKVDPVPDAELVMCEVCGSHLMCAPGHPSNLIHHGDGSHTVHVGHAERVTALVGPEKVDELLDLRKQLEEQADE